MDLLVREVQLDDAEGIVSVLNPIIEAGVYAAFDTPFTVEAEREYILQFPKHGVFHVAVCRQEQKIVGFQSCKGAMPCAPTDVPHLPEKCCKHGHPT